MNVVSLAFIDIHPSIYDVLSSYMKVEGSSGAEKEAEYKNC